MNRTLARRYIGYFIIVALAVSVISIYAASLIRRDAYDRTVGILEGANEVTLNILTAVDPGEMNGFIDRIAVEDVRITIIRSDGVVTADSSADITKLDNHADRPEVISAVNGVLGYSKRYSDSLKEDLVYVALPMVELGDGSYVIRSSMRVTDIDAALREIILQIVLTGVLTFIALSLLSYLSERRLIAPLADIQKAAEAYTSGNLDHHLTIPAPEDARVVADALNAMADALKERLAEISEGRDELNAVFTGMTEAVIVLGEDLTVRQINHAAMRVVEPGVSEPRGRSLIEVFRSTDLQALAEETLKSSDTTEGIIAFGGHRDLTFQVHGTRLPPTGRENSGIAIVLVMNDITKITRLETMRRDFVANVSHELKTPITNVKGYLETLADGAVEDVEKAGRFLDIAVRNADRLNAILDDLLSLSRLEQQNGDGIELETRALTGIIGGAIQACAPKAAQKNVTVKAEGTADLTAPVNVLLMEQALANLIDNAIKYSDDNGEVIVRVEEDEGLASIAVKDDGVGIPEKDLPRIFERFYRVDKARSRELGGTGLGLAIVKHIALVHGGSVRVESELGRGSTFIITLPVGEDSAGEIS